MLAFGLSERAYHRAADYARTRRLQGAEAGGTSRDKAPIVPHPDAGPDANVDARAPLWHMGGCEKAQQDEFYFAKLQTARFYAHHVLNRAAGRGPRSRADLGAR
ncbi:hypothetical protein D3C87_1370510 [compost metagenome]